MQFSHNSWTNQWMGAPTLSGKPPALCIGSVGDCQGVKASYREILWQLKSLGQIFWSKKTRFSWRRYVKTPAPRSSPHHCSHWLEWLSNESSNCSRWIGNGETSRLDHGMGKRMPKAVVTLARSFSKFQTLNDSQNFSQFTASTFGHSMHLASLHLLFSTTFGRSENPFL